MFEDSVPLCLRGYSPAQRTSISRVRCYFSLWLPADSLTRYIFSITFSVPFTAARSIAANPSSSE
jgi:hypothetical protein